MSPFYLIPLLLIIFCLGYLLCALLVLAKKMDRIAKEADRIAKKADQIANKLDRRFPHEPSEEPPPDLPGH
jgi:hypothetical protein